MREPIRILWAAPEIEAQQIQATYTQPAGDEEIEAFVEYVGKVKNALIASDELPLRLAAQQMAALCPSLLIPLNTPAPVRTPSEALKTILAFPLAPPHYREDMLICLGFADSATSISDVYTSALRLARGTIRLLQADPTAIPADAAPNIPLYLSDGSLLHYLEQ